MSNSNKHTITPSVTRIDGKKYHCGFSLDLPSRSLTVEYYDGIVDGINIKRSAVITLPTNLEKAVAVIDAIAKEDSYFQSYVFDDDNKPKIILKNFSMVKRIQKKMNCSS